MSSWTFAASTEGWNFPDWSGSDGHTAAGCITSETAASSLLWQNASPEVDVVAGDNLSAWVRLIEDPTLFGYNAGTVTVTLRALASTGSGKEVSQEFVYDGVAPAYDSGWVKLQTTFSGNGHITALQVEMSSVYEGEALMSFLRVDDVYLDESEPAPEPAGYELTHSAAGLPGAVLI